MECGSNIPHQIQPTFMEYDLSIYYVYNKYPQPICCALINATIHTTF